MDPMLFGCRLVVPWTSPALQEELMGLQVFGATCHGPCCAVLPLSVVVCNVVALTFQALWD